MGPVRGGAPVAMLAMLLLGQTIAHAQTPPPLDEHKAECVAAHADYQISRKKAALRAAKQAAQRCSAIGCPDLLRNDCVTWVVDADRDMPSIVVTATMQASDIAHADVYVDGELATNRLDGKGIELDPGPHVLRVVTASHREQTRSVVLREAEKNRVVAFHFDAPPQATHSPSSSVSSREPSHLQLTRPTPLGVYVLAGVALAGGATFLWLHSSATSKRQDLESTCMPFCSKADADAMQSKLTASYVTLGVAGASLAAAVSWYLLRPSVAVDDRGKHPRAAMAVSPSPQGGTIDIHLWF